MTHRHTSRMKVMQGARALLEGHRTQRGKHMTNVRFLATPSPVGKAMANQMRRRPTPGLTGGSRDTIRA
jgi:hypothetical protein